MRYIHAGRELGLAESYNIGWRATSSPYVCLMANDILPFPLETVDRLLEVIQAPDVGCVFPYLTDGLYTQHTGFSDFRSRFTCEPASMTLNLNMFRRSVLEAVGGVDERFAVGYYDPLLLMGVRRQGYRAVLVGGTKAIHFDQLTKQLGGSTLLPGRLRGRLRTMARRVPALRSQEPHREPAPLAVALHHDPAGDGALVGEPPRSRRTAARRGAPGRPTGRALAHVLPSEVRQAATPPLPVTRPAGGPSRSRCAPTQSVRT